MWELFKGSTFSFAYDLSRIIASFVSITSGSGAFICSFIATDCFSYSSGPTAVSVKCGSIFMA